ncbi:MarR family winged helix-turn-helix transcriptional regulator [Actinoplanes sp. NPDC051494]|uniref:MarR family winged helix-turn-helix transcriptional regulator n=1 Tax=Actinoplanes sp. NPDC051494 TaxID=3363907 RepID=UPI00379FCD74
MTEPTSLNAADELLWASLGRAVHLLPRTLDADMVKATGLSMTEYAVLYSLARTPDRRMRMTDLAAATGLSASRISRVADHLASHGLLSKQRSEGDARSSVALLSDAGLRRQREADAHHVAIARRRVLDLVDPAHREAVGVALERIADSA